MYKYCILLLPLHCPGRSLGFTILGEIFAYVTVYVHLNITHCLFLPLLLASVYVHLSITHSLFLPLLATVYVHPNITHCLFLPLILATVYVHLNITPCLFLLSLATVYVHLHNVELILRKLHKALLKDFLN